MLKKVMLLKWHDFFLCYGMKQPDYLDIIPNQQTGWEVNAASDRDFSSEQAARNFYQIAKNRLLDVNNWQRFAGKLTASFQLTNHKGEPVNRTAQKGDLFRVDIPGPGTIAGKGFDWVRIEALDSFADEHREATAIRVRPIPSPQHPDEGIAHFFSDDSTSTFTVRRENSRVFSSIHDRNAKPNTETEHVADKIRNAAVATGAIAAFSKLQWQSLVEGILIQD